MSGGISPKMRLRCFYCDEHLLLPFRKLRSQDAAHDELRRHDWIFGVESLGDGAVAFDPLCPTHGREVIAKMLESGGSVSPDAEKSLREIYPDLFDEGEPS